MDNQNGVVEQIIALEWEMFTSVNDGEARASCQDDRVTFEGMRVAQFGQWSPEAAASYLEDLEAACLCGRNLAEEKYIHMMRTTEPSRYNALLSRITATSDTIRSLAQEISDILLEQTRVLFEDYPYTSGQGRPLYSTFDYAGISVETYQLGELLTYSEKTLTALKTHITELEKKGESLAYRILENTVKFYGYESLDKAEAATKERADKAGIEITFGCCAGGTCDV